MLLTCTKRYTDIPFTHRQPFHDGHCRHLHGHNWTFVFKLGCRKLEVDTGFVIDFSKLKWLKHWIAEHFDHAFVMQPDDPEITRWETLQEADLIKLIVIPSCSSEGIAQYLFGHVDRAIRERTMGRVYLVAVEVLEDSKNSAVYTA